MRLKKIILRKTLFPRILQFLQWAGLLTYSTKQPSILNEQWHEVLRLLSSLQLRVQSRSYTPFPIVNPCTVQSYANLITILEKICIFGRLKNFH